MTQADLTGVAEQQIQADHDYGIHGDPDCDVEQEAVRPRERERGQNGDKDDEAEVGSEERHTRSVTLAPSSPRGMKMNTKRINTKAIASL